MFRKYKPLIFPKDPILMPPHRLPFDEAPALWAWVKENPGVLRPWEWIALQWTYDWAMVKREDFVVVSEALRRFADAHVLPDRVCHLPEVAARLDALTANETDVRAVAHYHTSVGDNLWWRRIGDDEGEPYNIDTGDKHWFIDCKPATRATG